MTNSPEEENQCLAAWGAGLRTRTQVTKDGRMFDELVIMKRDKSDATVRFDITGYACEPDLKP